MSVPVLSFLGALSNRAAEEKEVRTVKQTLHVDQVLPLLDSGDIVLFKTKGLLQSMQRSVLSSEYDHVGLVVRYPIRPRDPVRSLPLARALAPSSHASARARVRRTACTCWRRRSRACVATACCRGCAPGT
jgi:hypothetical protein